MKAVDFFDKASEHYIHKMNWAPIVLIRRIERSSILEFVNPKAGEEILDVGCGAGYYYLYLKEEGCKIIGLDSSRGMIKTAREQGLTSFLADIATFKLNKKFSKIICIGSLEFCKNPEKVITNLSQHLKTGGRIYFLIPRVSIFGILYGLYHLSHSVKINLFTLRKFKGLLRKANLEVKKSKSVFPLNYLIEACKV